MFEALVAASATSRPGATLGTVDAWRQREHGVRFDWGIAGARSVAEQADVAVVVDVLSFTTTLSVALDGGASVIPSRWRDARSARLAREHDAVLAVGRSQAGPGDVSLSPTTLRRGPVPARIVLPSPNGATIAEHLGTTATLCLGAGLRNARAVAAWLAARHDPDRSTVAVVAAGEEWPDGALRPDVEDLWGAGAVIDHLERAGWSATSPEAAAARAAWLAAADDPLGNLLSCGTGRELVQSGYRADVLVAAEVGARRSGPVLRGGAFADES